MTVVTETEDPDVQKALIVAEYEASSRRALQICDLLEALADDLPRRQAPVWRETQRQCKEVLRPHFGFLSSAVLPTLLRHTVGDADRQNVLKRMLLNDISQLHSLDDLDDFIFEALTSERFGDDAETLGFALRGYFDMLRHNLTWEIDVLWPLVNGTITTAVAKELKSKAPKTTAAVH